MKKDYYNLDLAVIMNQQFIDEGMSDYVPFKIVEGYFCEEDECFYDIEGTPYSHIIYNIDSYGYMGRIGYDSIKKQYPLLNLNLIKKVLLHELKKYKYTYYLPEDNSTYGAPVILYGKNSKDIKVMLNLHTEEDKNARFNEDVDLINFYEKYCPTFYYYINNKQEQKNLESKEIIDEEKLIEEVNSKLVIKELYYELTANVIDQDKPIKEILTAVWKQINNFSNEKSRNILINGGTGVGKTQIFRILTKLIDIPCVITSATQYSATGYIGGNVEDMLVSLVKRADGDIEKAQKGILIIDEIDKLAETNIGHSQVNQKDVQESLLKILEDGILTIEIDKVDYEFDTSNLMVIGMGSWSRIEVKPEKTIGFGAITTNQKKTYKDITREDMIKNGMLPDFIGRFNTIVQMNDLTYDSFLKILKSKNSSLKWNKEFFDKRGIKLTINEEACKAIADKASKSSFGARDLDSIIERALSVASFEIATNPDKYSELIIDEETINNNEKYTLVKKQTKEN